MSIQKIAIPSMAPGGMEAVSSGHFGHCEAFTLIDVEGKEIKDVKVLPNPPHEQGGCMAPVMLLKEKGVDVIIVGGIGMRPMMGFQQVGIQVYSGASGNVESVINDFIEGRLKPAGEDVVCGHSTGASANGSGCSH